MINREKSLLSSMWLIFLDPHEHETKNKWKGNKSRRANNHEHEWEGACK